MKSCPGTDLEDDLESSQSDRSPPGTARRHPADRDSDRVATARLVIGRCGVANLLPLRDPIAALAVDTMTPASCEIRDLGVIGDQRTAAILGADGGIVWYCPGRFDQPSLLSRLLDSDHGGHWSFLGGPRAAGRGYLEDSAVLRTRLETPAGSFTVTDWMPMGDGVPRSICRQVSAPPEPLGMWLKPAPGYGGQPTELAERDGGVCINGRWWLYSSGRLEVVDGAVHLQWPEGEPGWAVLADEALASPGAGQVQAWLDGTLDAWRDITARIKYHGPFERQVAQSLRALRLLTFADSGGIIAAATTSLPEVPGGDRNYDYRYVWMRDAGMIVSALVRAGSTGRDEELFLEFICRSRQDKKDALLLPPFLTLDSEPAPAERHLDLPGFQDSRPVRIGNGANEQLQLDGFANVLLAAKLIYGRHDRREHWETVRQIADFLADHWHRPDSGIWEEHDTRQYTSSKVIVSCGLRYIADFADDAAQAERWRQAAGRVEDFVADNCLTREGAYAAFAGTQAVDVSAILLPAWGYCDPDTPEMLATIAALERDYRRGDLYWRHLEELEPFREGAFLAGTIWVAQYWVIRKDLDRARRILEAALEYANDLGFFAEEADPDSGAMLGNFPQTFVHASLIGAVIDYRNEVQGRSEQDRDPPRPGGQGRRR
ncbi:MAG: glycoside hydrolase family 15 protein [Pseudomonadota bacterium]|nr:glycoside hydrolase family 15 protein [Pseudomonadota bacterium]